MNDILNKFKILLYNPIIVYLFLLIGISLLAISSSIPLTGIQYDNPESFVFKQIMFYGLGFICTIGVVIMGNDRIRAMRWWIYGFCMIPLFGLVIHKYTPINIPFAHEVNGATAWYLIKGIGTIQPAEFMKIAILLVVADIIQNHNEVFLHQNRNVRTDFILLLKIMAAILPPSLLIFIQPDSGIVLIILAFVAFMIFASGIKWRYIFSVAGILVVVVSVFITLVAYAPDFLMNTLGVAPYKLSRFMGWFDPFGTIQQQGHQLALGLLAIGSGNLVGNGFQSGLQFFPEPHTDFIFAVIGMDFGLIGTVATVVTCLLFDYEILNVAVLNRNHYSSYVCIGIFGMLLFQQIQNIGMTIGLLPITGVTLPFISYGGSSSLSYMILFGLVLSGYIEGIKIKHQEVDYYEHTLYLKTKAYIKPEHYNKKQ
ncbi:MAG TPA: FtsW/RodA/SpoVE family cell cycle protein [Firmicutes bacterium]|nr:FtsW/RodA/SpoVE family cell cycle protein [Bacillota bacterium]